VAAFRKQYLASGLLRADEVDGWLHTAFTAMVGNYWPYPDPWTGDRATPVSKWATGAPPSRPRPEHAAVWPEHDDLEIYLPTDGGHEFLRFPVRPPQNCLGRLTVLSREHAKPWATAPAVVALSILTGREVEAPSVQIAGEFHLDEPTASVVSLKVDPYITPAQLSMVWADLRAQIFEQVPRQQSEKHLDLASHRLRNADLGWPALRQRWNRDHPDHAYDATDHRMFKRDVKAAVRRFAQPVPIRL
jgi:hypothetical protein